MFLVILTALAAVCGAAKLDQSYLPPASARLAGGSPGALQVPIDVSNHGVGGPTGSYANDVQGIVVDAVNPGTRTSGAEPTGLGGPRASYGSTNSKVGDAAFSGSVTGSGSPGPNTRIAPGFGSFVGLDDSQRDKTSGNHLKFTSDVGLENYSYEFETDNGISAGENGVASNGVQAQGGYSYKGDDGKTYSVSYTADEGGYKPHGQHLPTPPPIPDEILKSLEKNAKEEAAGHVDDGSYDAQKYNNEGDYSSNSAVNNNVRPTKGGGDATSIGSYVSQSSQSTRPTSGVLVGSYNPGSGQSSQELQLEHRGDKDSEKKQSAFGIKKGQSAAQPLPISLHSTDSRFGIHGSHAQTQGSVAGAPVRTQSFHNLPGSSAYSSAIATGSGSASAYASTGSLGSGLKNEYTHPLSPFESAGQHTKDSKSGSDSSTGASFPAPSTAIASASVSGTQTQQYSDAVLPSAKPQHSTNFPSTVSHGSNIQGLPTAAPSSDFHTHSQLPNSPSSASAYASVSGNQGSFGQSNAFPSRFREGQQSGNTEYLPPVESNKPSLHSKPQGFDSSSAASTANFQPFSQHSSHIPSSSSGSSSSGVSSQQTEFQSQTFNSKPGQYTSGHTQSTSGQFGSQGPTKVSNGLVQPTSVFNSQSSNEASNSFGSNNIQVLSSTPATLISSTQTGPIDASSSSSTQRPTFTQQKGSDDSYYYKHPLKPFKTPTASPNKQYSNNHQSNFPTSSLSQQGSKYPNTPTTSTSGQYQGTSSSSYSGITQAAISPFTSSSPSSSTPFSSQSGQFGVKPTQSTQFGQSVSSQQTSTQFGVTGTQFGQKPIVQSQTQFGQSSTSQISDSSHSPSQQYQGTIYHYNKPAETLSTQGHKDTTSTFGQGTSSQVSTDSRFGSQQGSSQFGAQSSFQQSQTQGSNTQTSQFGVKPTVGSQTPGSNYQKPQFGSSSFSSFTNTQQSQFGTKPIGSTQSGSYNQYTTSSPVTKGPSSFVQKPIGNSQTSFQQTQFGSFGSDLGQKQQTTLGSSFTSNTNSQSQSSQFEKKPVGTTQIGSTYQQGQYGSTGPQFGQKPQITQGSTFTSNKFSQGQTSQFIKKPISSTQTGSTSQQTQFGSTGTQFGQNSQSTQGSGLTLTSSQTSFGIKPVYQQAQFASSYEKKPVSSTQTGSTSQNGQFGSTGSQFGQNSQSTLGSGLASTTVKPSFGQKPFSSSYQQTQYGSTGSQLGQTAQGGLVSTTSKPSFGSTYQQTQFGSTGSQFSQGQTTQYGKNPVSTTQTGSTLQQTQFGLTGSQFGQNSQSTQGSGIASTTIKPSFGQKPFGSSYQQSQYGSTGSQFSQGQTSQYGKNPVSTSQTGSTLQQTQFGLTGSQFGQNLQSTQGSGLASTTIKPSFGQKPFGSSYQQSQFGSTGSQFSQGQTSQYGKNPVSTTQTGSTLQQTQFGLTGSQFGQNSQSTQGSGLASTTIKPSFGQKPFGSSYQQSQYGSTGSQFSQGQTSQYGKNPVSTTQTGSTLQQTQFGLTGSQFGQNSQSTQGSGIASTTIKPSFGQKPFGSSYQQTQFGSTGSQFSQGQTSQYGKKPVITTQTDTASQNAQFGSTSPQFGQTSQSGLASTTLKPSFGQKPFSSSYQQTQYGSTGSQLGQTAQGGLASTTSKPSFGSTYQQTQFGSTGSQFSQGQTSQYGKKPVSTTQTGSTLQQTQFGLTSSQFGQKPQSTSGTGVTSTIIQSIFGQKPSTTSQTDSFYQQPQFGSAVSQSASNTFNTGSKGQAVQTSQFGLTGSSQNTGFSSQNTQIGSAAGSQYGQKPQASQGIISFNSGLGTQNQFGQTSQSGNNLSGSSSALGSSYQQTQFASTSGSKFGQSTQGSQGTISQAQPIQTTQYGIKPFSSSPNTQGSTQVSSTPSRFGQTSQISVPTVTTISQTVQPTQIGQKPFDAFGAQTNKPYDNTQTHFGSSAAHFGQKPQAHASAFASSDSNVAPFGSSQTGQVSKYQTSQFGVQNQGVTSTQKPLGSYLSQTNYQQSQYTQTSDKFGSQPQFGLSSQSNVGNGQIGSQTTFDAQSQKPFGSQSTQTTYQQTQYNQDQKPFASSQGSAIQVGQSVGDQPSQGSVQTTSVAGQYSQSSFGSAQSGNGYNYLKPQSVLTNKPQAQKVQQSQSNSVVSTTQSINGQSLKPFGATSNQGTFQQTQSTVGSSQFGAQPTKATEISGPIIQTSYNQFSGRPFKPASTTSTGSGFQGQTSAVSSSLYGVQPTKPAEITYFSGQPFQSASTQESSFESQTLGGSTPQFGVQPTQSVVVSTQKPSQSQFSSVTYQPAVFSTTQAPSFPSRVGEQNVNVAGLAVSSVQTPIEPVPGYEIVTPSGYVGQLEEFGGPRDPPRFDDKTGYHY